MTLWTEEVKDRPVAEVAQVLGLKVGRQHIHPCPKCGVSRPGSARIVHGGKGWRCWRCGAAGTSLDVLAYLEVGDRLAKGDPRWVELRDKAISRGLCSGERAGPFVPRQRFRPPPLPPRPRPPHGEIQGVWENARTVFDPGARAWLESRGLDVAAVAGLDLARVLPPRARLPSWASFRGRPWTETGHRLLVRTMGPGGGTESLRARNLRPDVPPAEKTAAAAAGERSAGGMVYANLAGRRLLRRGRLGPPARVLLVEGDPDWLTWATAPTVLEEGWAVLGVWSGAWTPEFAERIPDGSTVVLRLHIDHNKERAGQKYAEAIVRTLALRRVEVHQLVAEEMGGDAHEAATENA